MKIYIALLFAVLVLVSVRFFEIALGMMYAPDELKFFFGILGLLLWILFIPRLVFRMLKALFTKSNNAIGV